MAQRPAHAESVQEKDPEAMADDQLAKLSRGEYSTAEDRADAIAGAPALYTLAQVEELTALPRESIVTFMRSMGLPVPPEQDVAY
ncbi:MAG: hypothetical protein LBL01_03080, partial [Bifidobacteriaceae bacterium]|nr:hypothetical protein [Bifidobacteriaceae bacterium]